MTWADIVGASLHEQGYSCYNIGRPGAGNIEIASSIVRIDSIFNFTPDDIIMVVWSSWHREDRFLSLGDGNGYGWGPGGQIFWNATYDDNFISKYWSLENDIIKNSVTIRLCQKAYDLAFEGHYFGESLGSLPFDETTASFLNFTPKNIFSNSFKVVETPQDYMLDRLDGHPLPYAHKKYVTEIIQPNFTNVNLLTDNTIKLIDQNLAEIRNTISSYSSTDGKIDLDLRAKLHSYKHELLNGVVHSDVNVWSNRNGAYLLFDYMRQFL